MNKTILENVLVGQQFYMPKDAALCVRVLSRDLEDVNEEGLVPYLHLNMYPTMFKWAFPFEEVAVYA